MSFDSYGLTHGSTSLITSMSFTRGSAVSNMATGVRRVKRSASRSGWARLMRVAGFTGVSQRRCKGRIRLDPFGSPNPDLVQRQFKVVEPDPLWVTDDTEHPDCRGQALRRGVLDAYSPAGHRVVDSRHMRS